MGTNIYNIIKDCDPTKLWMTGVYNFTDDRLSQLLIPIVKTKVFV
jgi:hypothetical protein